MTQNGWISLADGGYQDEPNLLITLPRPFAPQERVFHRRVLIENFFARLKVFRCLKCTWRHNLFYHKHVFRIYLNAIIIELQWHSLHHKINFIFQLFYLSQIPQVKLF